MGNLNRRQRELRRRRSSKPSARCMAIVICDRAAHDCLPATTWLSEFAGALPVCGREYRGRVTSNRTATAPGAPLFGRLVMPPSVYGSSCATAWTRRKEEDIGRYVEPCGNCKETRPSLRDFRSQMDFESRDDAGTCQPPLARRVSAVRRPLLTGRSSIVEHVPQQRPKPTRHLRRHLVDAGGAFADCARWCPPPR